MSYKQQKQKTSTFFSADPGSDSRIFTPSPASITTPFSLSFFSAASLLWSWTVLLTPFIPIILRNKQRERKTWRKKKKIINGDVKWKYNINILMEIQKKREKRKRSDGWGVTSEERGVKQVKKLSTHLNENNTFIHSFLFIHIQYLTRTVVPSDSGMSLAPPFFTSGPKPHKSPSCVTGSNGSSKRKVKKNN